MRKMKRLADAKKLDEAMDELAEAKNHLSKIDSSSTGHEDDADCAHLLDELCRELEHLEELLESHKVYHEHGSAYMLAAILSHDRQSFAARGRDDDVMLYMLPRMLKYARQADEFHKNPDVDI